MSRSKCTIEQKLAVLQMVKEAEYTLSEICEINQISNLRFIVGKLNMKLKV